MLCTSFSTRSLPPPEMARAWKRVVAGHFGPLDTEADVCNGFAAELHLYELGDLRLFRIRAPAHRVGHQQVRHQGPAADAFKLVLQVQGEAQVQQGMRQVQLRPGDWTLYDPRQPYSILNRTPMEEIVLWLPRHCLPVAPMLVGRPDDAELASVHRMVSGYLDCLVSQLPSLPGPVAHTVSQAAISLIVSALNGHAQGRVQVPMLAHVTRERVKELVAVRLADPQLSIDEIARALRCSRRYLYKVFQDEGTTLERHIWDQRLDRCREALAARDHQGGLSQGAISQVAFAWGFGSAAHFTRLFKARYGVTPSAFRASVHHVAASASPQADALPLA